MTIPQTPETCADHKLSVTGDKKEERVNRVQRAQWLRAAILGANDGLLSTTLLMLGVGAAKEDQWSMILSGLAGAISGAFSMAVGEFVSVSTQRDIESAAIEKCSTKGEDDGGDIKLQITDWPNPTIIETNPAEVANSAMSPAPTHGILCQEGELSKERGSPAMTPGRTWPTVSSPARSPLTKVIIRDERKNTPKGAEEEEENKGEALPNPYKAAAASAAAFFCGSLFPLVSSLCVAENTPRMLVIVVVTSIALALFGVIGAHLGGLPLRVSAARLLLGGWISMVITYSLLKPLDRDDRGHRNH